MDVSFNQGLRKNREAFVNASKQGAFASHTQAVLVSKSVRWFPIKNHDGKTWWVEMTTHEEREDMRGRSGSRGLSGLTLPDDKLVLVDAGDSRRIQDYITLHEVMHVSLDGEDGVSGKAEERVISKMAPNLYPILHRFGLRWPERSEEIQALEKRARRTRK